MLNYKLIIPGVFALTACANGEKNSSQTSSSNKEEIPVNQNEVSQTQADDGKTFYLQHCMACHQMDGSGVPGMYPPLKESDWVNGDKKKLISTVLHGLEGEIKVNGEIFSQVMPRQDSLSDEQIAKILSYVRQNFGNKAEPITDEDVKGLRGAKKK